MKTNFIFDFTLKFLAIVQKREWARKWGMRTCTILSKTCLGCRILQSPSNIKIVWKKEVDLTQLNIRWIFSFIVCISFCCVTNHSKTQWFPVTICYANDCLSHLCSSSTLGWSLVGSLMGSSWLDNPEWPHLHSWHLAGCWHTYIQ
jgi:hypothetical protein